jgi:hypothetical protein
MNVGVVRVVCCGRERWPTQTFLCVANFLCLTARGRCPTKKLPQPNSAARKPLPPLQKFVAAQLSPHTQHNRLQCAPSPNPRQKSSSRSSPPTAARASRTSSPTQPAATTALSSVCRYRSTLCPLTFPAPANMPARARAATMSANPSPTWPPPSHATTFFPSESAWASSPRQGNSVFTSPR